MIGTKVHAEKGKELTYLPDDFTEVPIWGQFGTQNQLHFESLTMGFAGCT